MASLTGLVALERRLDKLTGPSAAAKPVLLVCFGESPRSPMTAAECWGVTYLRRNESEADFLERIARENPPTRNGGTVIYPA